MIKSLRRQCQKTVDGTGVKQTVTKLWPTFRWGWDLNHCHHWSHHHWLGPRGRGLLINYKCMTHTKAIGRINRSAVVCCNFKCLLDTRIKFVENADKNVGRFRVCDCSIFETRQFATGGYLQTIVKSGEKSLRTKLRKYFTFGMSYFVTGHLSWLVICDSGNGNPLFLLFQSCILRGPAASLSKPRLVAGSVSLRW